MVTWVWELSLNTSTSEFLLSGLFRIPHWAKPCACVMYVQLGFMIFSLCPKSRMCGMGQRKISFWPLWLEHRQVSIGSYRDRPPCTDRETEAHRPPSLSLGLGSLTPWPGIFLLHPILMAFARFLYNYHGSEKRFKKKSLWLLHQMTYL